MIDGGSDLSSGILRTEDVVELLRTEALSEKSAGGVAINLNRSPDEMIANGIQLVLEQKGMTRTKAAE